MEDVAINKIFMIKRKMREWKYVYNIIRIIKVDTPCSCGSASGDGRFNLREEGPVDKRQKTLWTSYRLLTLCGERFLSLQQYNPDPSVNKPKHKLITFNNAVRLNSMKD
jgi:hypothetical protein